jgi:signal transduction histidine kinase
MTFFSLISRLIFTVVFILLLPKIIERVNTYQTDIELIHQREKVIKLIEDKGLEQFIYSDSVSSFGSYNILKNEFINIEKTNLKNTWNFIEVTDRIIEGEIIKFRILSYSFKVHGQNYLLEIGKSAESIKSAEETTKKVILVFLILFICITIASDLLYTRHLLRPLNLIIKKLKSTASPEMFDKSPVNSSTADFVRLNQTLNELMDKISASFSREKEITVNISHELLTPVSIIRSKLENILMNGNTDENVQIKIEESLTTLTRLSSLVNSMLLIARIESSQYLKEETFTAAEILNDVCDEILPVAENKKISIRRELSGSFIIETANRSLLFSMFFNIINNSVKNTAKGGEILVTTVSENDISRIIISDTGRGMSREKMETLFSRFRSRQGDESDGTGIGLAIAKSIADFHNIKIDVKSEPGKGSEFSFTFFKNS